MERALFRHNKLLPNVKSWLISVFLLETFNTYRAKVLVVHSWPMHCHKTVNEMT